MFLDILVIGDKNHGRAKCVDWMEEFPNIEEFDLVIIALNRLTQEIFDRIPRKPASIAREIGTVWENGRSVWCIMEDVLRPSRPAGGPKAVYGSLPSNYDWLPLPIVVDKVKEGPTVQVVDSMAAEKFRPYLDKVRRWDLEIVDAGLQDRRILLAPIATNKSGKMISAAIVWSTSVEAGILLLPKPTTCDTHEAIEVLIDIATGEDRLESEWRDQIEIPGISTIDTEIMQHEGEFALVQKKINELKAKRQELEKYRDVFSVHEDPQIEAVKRTLQDMNIETERTPPKFPVDLLGKEIAVEVTSIADKIGTSSDAPFQLLRFREKYRKNEKVVLVANTYKREDPKVRKGKMDFTPEVLSMLAANSVCAMTSATLLDIWKLAKQDKTKARKAILQGIGEVRL